MTTFSIHLSSRSAKGIWNSSKARSTMHLRPLSVPPRWCTSSTDADSRARRAWLPDSRAAAVSCWSLLAGVREVAAEAEVAASLELLCRSTTNSSSGTGSDSGSGTCSTVSDGSCNRSISSRAVVTK